MATTAIDEIEKIMQQVNSDVIAVICNRLNTIGKLTTTDAIRLANLAHTEDLNKIMDILSQATGKSKNEVFNAVEEASQTNDRLAEQYYKARNMDNTVRSDVLNALRDRTSRTMYDGIANLADTTAFFIDGKASSITETYTKMINKGIYATQQGLTDYNTAIRGAVGQLADSGLRVIDFESGYSRRLDSQVRMNVLDGIRQMNMQYREQQGKEFGADGVEISAHALCAMDHLDIQGKQFHNMQWEHIDLMLDRPIGTMNCKHYTMPIVYGVSKPTYSDAELQAFKDNSTAEVTYTDKLGRQHTCTRYDSTQLQRKQETCIRRLKDKRNAYEAVGDTAMVAEIDNKIKANTKYYKDLSGEIGLKPKMDRTRVVDPNKTIKPTPVPTPQPQPAPVPEQKSIDDINKKLSKNTGINIDLTGLKIDDAELLAGQIENLTSKYNTTAKIEEIKIGKTMGSSGGETFYGSDGKNAVITLPKSVSKAGYYDMDRLSWDTVQIDNEAGSKLRTFTHEFAHSIAPFKATGTNTEFWDEIKKLKNQYSRELTKIDKENIVKKTITTEQANEMKRKIFISKYASENAGEFMAEAFADAMLSKNPSDYSVKVKEVIDKYFGKNAGSALVKDIVDVKPNIKPFEELKKDYKALEKNTQLKLKEYKDLMLKIDKEQINKFSEFRAKNGGFMNINDRVRISNDVKAKYKDKLDLLDNEIKEAQRIESNAKTELFNHPDIANKHQILKNIKVNDDVKVYNPVKKLKSKQTDDEIINKIAGGDKTKGSCVSLSYAYVGNKNGLDVIDFRGGDSQKFFSHFGEDQRDFLKNLFGKVNVVKDKKDFSAFKTLTADVEQGKEYWLIIGTHSSIVRKTEDGWQYLELQSNIKNGWKNFDGNVNYTLKHRFGCSQKTKYESTSFLIDISTIKKNDDFDEILGYINTNVDKQQKGVGGYAK